MADILIRDVEMPIDCRSCWMRGYCYERGMGIWGCGKGKPCPLIQLPEGHGRLIDADKLLRDNPEFADRDFCHPKYDMTLRDLIEMAKTVVMAGKEDTE